MKRIFCLSLVLGFLFSLSVPVSAAVESIGQVMMLQGRARAVAQDGSERELAVDAPVFNQDRIMTEADSRLQIRFEDDTLLSQGEKSEMVIDDYVYSPGEAESRSFFKLVGGVFRAITGRITDMNPENFKVRTGKAVMGIRGCDILFTITRVREDIYVLDLPEGHSIVIESRFYPMGWGQGSSELVTMTLDNSGDGVVIMDSGEVIQTQFTPDQIRAVIQMIIDDDDSDDTEEERTAKEDLKETLEALLGDMDAQDQTDVIDENKPLPDSDYQV